MMVDFQVSVHARPESVAPGPRLVLRGILLHTLSPRPDELSLALPVSFDDAAAALQLLPRLFYEPDGSFVWVGRQAEPRWQLDGNLFERGGRLQFVDLKGSCPEDEFDTLLAAFGAPETGRMVQLVREAVFLDEPAFRLYAARPASGQA